MESSKQTIKTRDLPNLYQVIHFILKELGKLFLLIYFLQISHIYNFNIGFLNHILILNKNPAIYLPSIKTPSAFPSNLSKSPSSFARFEINDINMFRLTG
jgi:hypothetical protein